CRGYALDVPYRDQRSNCYRAIDSIERVMSGASIDRVGRPTNHGCPYAETKTAHYSLRSRTRRLRSEPRSAAAAHIKRAAMRKGLCPTQSPESQTVATIRRFEIRTRCAPGSSPATYRQTAASRHRANGDVVREDLFALARNHNCVIELLCGRT